MKGLPDTLDNHVGLFFVVHNELLLHSCTLNDAEKYGDFLNYPFSHEKVWLSHYKNKHRVDFDYFPRGRIVYNRVKQQSILYYDGCIKSEAKKIQSLFPSKTCIIARDEHYQCHKCCEGYVI